MFTYQSFQSLAAREWTKEMKNHSHRIAVNDYCTNPGMSEFKNQRVKLVWVISDSEGKHVTTNSVTPELCR